MQKIYTFLFACLLLFSITTVTIAQENVGIGTTSPDQKLDIEGVDDQFVRIHTTSYGVSNAGLELLRGTEFLGTDWKIVNEGGVLQFYDGIDNFLTAGELNMTITASGNLGLGTSAPERKLEVEGMTDQFIRVHTTNAGSSTAGIELIRSSEFSGTDWRILNEGGTLRFYDGIDNFQTPGDLNMTLTNSGNLGLGIMSPEAPLHIIGSELVNETGDGYLQLGSPAGFHLRFDNNEILARNGDNSSSLYLQYWSGNLLLCEDDAGRVGIGNVSPQAKLHITDGTDVTLAGGGQLVMGSTTGPNLAMDGNEIQARDNGLSSHLFFQTSGGDVLMIPNETGQVGIGVTSSANMPSNDYLLAVDGKIISEEVRVEISGSWPDYVFEKDYKLTPLGDLEKSIVANGHLPGIPSAEEIENDGLLLGDMQKRMMEKIEELTLYVIALQKEIEILKEDRR